MHYLCECVLLNLGPQGKLMVLYTEPILTKTSFFPFVYTFPLCSLLFATFCRLFLSFVLSMRGSYVYIYTRSTLIDRFSDPFMPRKSFISLSSLYFRCCQPPLSPYAYLINIHQEALFSAEKLGSVYFCIFRFLGALLTRFSMFLMGLTMLFVLVALIMLSRVAMLIMILMIGILLMLFVSLFISLVILMTMLFMSIRLRMGRRKIITIHAVNWSRAIRVEIKSKLSNFSTALEYLFIRL